jgi:histidyl-tRNA synthetase
MENETEKMRFAPVKGMKDFMPEEAETFQRMIDVVRRIFEKYGFQPLITPALESFELLSVKGGLGEGVKDEIYYFRDKGDREVGLRFDLTMPLARIISSNLNLPMPFKRYAIDRAWRYDNPQALRYREFWQADIDIIGSKEITADIECLCAAVEILETLGVENFKIYVSNRKLIQGILEKLGLRDDEVTRALRIIDKVKKIGIEETRKQLEEIKKFDVETLIKLLEMKGSVYEKIDKIEKLFPDVDGLEDLKKFFLLALDFGILDYLNFDLSIVRGLDYYTGLVFEILLPESNVSFGGGGRYDNLIKTISGVDYPAVGISLGLTRLFQFLVDRGLIKTSPPAKIFVAAVSDGLRSTAMKIVRQLRAAGVRTEWDISGRKLSKQLEYASALRIPYVAIIGENEIKLSSIKVRNMTSGEEIMMPMGSFIAWAREI